MIGAVDMDGDGRDDVIWRNTSTGQAVVWRMDGRQLMTGMSMVDGNNQQLLIPGNSTLEKAIDWNGDGKSDLLLRNMVTNQVSVWLMNGKQRSSILDLAAELNMGSAWKLEGVGEMTGDRKVDLLWRNQSTGAVSVWQMVNGAVVNRKTLDTMAVANWEFVGMADFNGDGKQDAVWRNKQSQAVKIWEMYETGIKQSYDRSSNEFSGTRKAFGAMQSTMTSVQLTVNLSVESDTGIDSKDGITKVRSPKVTGVAMPGATVTLLANDAIVGNAIVGISGKWEIISQELSDGNYDLKVEIRTQSGQVIKRNVKAITIDTTAPQFGTINGLMDGVAWESSDVFSGLLKDIDKQTKLEYWVNNETKQSISLNAAQEFNNISLNLISNLATNKEHKLHLKSIDRAGNETQYDYSFMRLDLPELTEDTDWTGPVEGGEDDRNGNGSGPNGGTLPGGAGGTYYIGVGGGWGYSSGSGGGGWNPGSFGGNGGDGGNPPLPTKPGQDPNEQLTYLQALNVILNTAVDALSKHSSVVAKKKTLEEFKSDLLAMGKIIEFYGLRESFKTEFNELFSLGYDKTDDRVSWQEAVMAGWKFAKAVALDSKPVRLKAFESQVFGMVRGMMVKENISLSTTQEAQLKQTLADFSKQYARLKPIRDRYSFNKYTYDSGFEEMVWGIGETNRWSGIPKIRTSFSTLGEPTIENGWLGREAFNDLQKLLKGLTGQQVIDGFENTQVLMSAAIRTAPLWRSGNGVAEIRNGEFLHQLMETSFTLTQVGATNPTSIATSSSTWLEGVLEKNVQLVAGGLGEFFQGLNGTVSKWNYYNPMYAEGWVSYDNTFTDALDYGQRLMRAANSSTNLVLKSEMQRIDFSQSLLNLAGNYSAFRQMNPSNYFAGSYLDYIWTSDNLESNSQKISQYFEAIYSGTKDNEYLVNTFEFLRFLEFTEYDTERAMKAQSLATSIRICTARYSKWSRPPQGGSDDPVPTNNWRSASLSSITGKLFIQGSQDQNFISFDDVSQGAAGDCYLIAAMISAALTSPDSIRLRFTDLGNNRYKVNFFGGGFFGASTRIDTDLYTLPHVPNQNVALLYAQYGDVSSSDGVELWGPLLEKAYANVFAGGSYESIQNGNAGIAFQRITGRQLTQHNLHPFIGGWSQDDLFDQISSKSRSGQPLMLGTFATPSNSSMTGNHVYVVMGVNSVTKEIKLLNPDGKHYETRHISEIYRACDYLWTS